MARIAIVEDEPGQRRTLEALLQARGHEVQAFANGREALDGIDAKTHLVLTDLVMPEMDGVTLCATLRQQFEKAHLPIVVLSAVEHEEGIIEALDAGASDFISKPFAPSLLHAKIKIHLEARMRSASTRRAPPDTDTFTVDMERPSALPARYGHYLLVRVLGYGSYGVVYSAQGPEKGPPVALKILDRAINQNRRELSRYMREVATLSALDCEQIVRFVAAGHEEGRYYLAMEHVEGRTALDVLRFDGNMPVQDVLRVGVDVCRALEAIHGEGLVHRDVKPANVLLCTDGKTKLADFGLAKPHGDGSVTSSDELLGTVGYLAPEVVRGGEADERADLYALGVTLYELCAGVRAFKAPTALEVLRRVSEGWTAKPLAEHVPGFPDDVALLIGELMAFDPLDRLADALECRRRLEALLSERA